MVTQKLCDPLTAKLTFAPLDPLDDELLSSRLQEKVQKVPLRRIRSIMVVLAVLILLLLRRVKMGRVILLGRLE